MFWFCNASGVIAVTAIGTDCTYSSRFCAVTTTSSRTNTSSLPADDACCAIVDIELPSAAAPSTKRIADLSFIHTLFTKRQRNHLRNRRDDACASRQFRFREGAQSKRANAIYSHAYA